MHLMYFLGIENSCLKTLICSFRLDNKGGEVMSNLELVKLNIHVPFLIRSSHDEKLIVDDLDD
jgi:hypothetical protein